MAMDSVSLQTVLEVFSVPLSEEQGWAVCYQSASHLLKQVRCNDVDDNNWEDGDADPDIPASKNDYREPEISVFIYPVYNGIESVIMTRDGRIECRNENTHATQESEVIRSLGLVIYQALDYGLDEAEEHKLSPALESLIERMISGHHTELAERPPDHSDEGDEGIENDVDDESKRHDMAVGGMTLEQLMQFCSAHLENPSEAGAHYKAVCRAIVAECEELKSFLERVSTERERLQLDVTSAEAMDPTNLENLQSRDWARLWMQMMRELRQGVKLKKIDPCSMRCSVEFELTPYEILMEDIRTHRYTLNKVKINNLPPSTRKDAHHIMLEFIRSRPPLHPAMDRKLGTPPPIMFNPRDQLLNAIRSDPKLRPTPGVAGSETLQKDCTDNQTGGATRKIIKPNFNFFLSDEDDEDDDDHEHDDDDADDDDACVEEKNRVTPSPLSPLSPLSPQADKPSGSWQQTAVKSSDFARGLLQTFRAETRQSKPQDLSTILSSIDPHSYPASKISPATSKQSKKLETSLECLSLTIEEVMHIRNVLTKAELESLIVNQQLYDLVNNGKICFTCKQTKFSLFSNWSTKCKFCQRYVCFKCISKMQIPTEHFEHIPVYTLSPSPLSPGSENDIFTFELTSSVPGTTSQNSRTPSSVGSHSHKSSSSPDLTEEMSRAAAGPLSRLKELALQGAQLAMSSTHEPELSSAAGMRPALQRAHTILPGPTMSICRECKAMIVSIIRASRITLSTPPGNNANKTDKKPDRNFHLDLKPVYKSYRK